MNSELPGAICMDCQFGVSTDDAKLEGEATPGYFCKHWQPEYWESRGYKRNWGDAAVMNWPHMEILRQEVVTNEGVNVSFMILAPYAMRRPVKITALTPINGSRPWGSY